MSGICSTCGMHGNLNSRCNGCGSNITAPIQSINQSPAVMTSTISPIQPPMYLDPYAAFYEVSQGRPVITCKEFQRAIQLTGLEISLDVCNQFVRKFDIDKNGGIDIKEFDCIVAELGEWVRVFEFFDVDKSGRLDYGEFTKSLEKMGYHFPIELTNLIFTNFDHDHVGLIDFDHFIRVCSIVQIAKSKMQQYGVYGSPTITIDLNQLLDIIFTIAM